MLVRQIMDVQIPAASPSDTVQMALDIMDDYKLAHLPLVSEDNYLMLLREDVLLQTDSFSTLEDTLLVDYKPFVSSDAHIYEGIKILVEKNIDIVPVLDQEQKFVGSLKSIDCFHYLASHGSLDLPGGLICLEMEFRNYSLWEISRICESEGLKILNVQTKQNHQLGIIEIVLKLNSSDLSGVVQAFDRHSIDVKYVFGDTEADEDLLMRYKALMNYLNM